MYALAIAMLLMQILVFEIYQIGWIGSNMISQDRQVLRDISVFSSAIRSRSDVLCKDNRRSTGGYPIFASETKAGLLKTGQLWINAADWCDIGGVRKCRWGAFVKGRTVWLYRVPRYRSQTQEYAGLDGVILGPRRTKAGVADNFQLGIWPIGPNATGDEYWSDLPPENAIPPGSIVRYEHLCSE